MIRRLLLTTIVALPMLLTSCGVYQAVMPEHRMVIMIETAQVLNPDNSNGGAAAPLSVYFYQLKDVDTFNSADFFSLYEKGKDTLGGSLITISKVDLTPSTSARLTLGLTKDTKFIGVVAAYRDQDNTRWRMVLPVTSSWGREKLHLAFKQTGVDTFHVFDSGSDLNVKMPPKPNFGMPSDTSGPNMQYEVLSYKK